MVAATRPLRRLVVPALIGSCLTMIGCGTSAKPAAQGPKFQVEETTPAATPATTPAADPPAAAPTPTPKPLTPPKARPNPNNGDQAVTANDPQAGGLTESPEVMKLIGHLQTLSKQRPEGATKTEQRDSFMQMQVERIQVADLLLMSKASERVKLMAVDVVIESNSLLEQLGDTNAIPRMIEFAAKIAKSDSDKVAKRGRQMQFELQVANCIGSKGEGFDEVLASLEGILKESNDEATFQVAQQTCFVFVQTGMMKEAQATMAKVVEYYGKHENAEIVAEVDKLRDVLLITEIGFEKAFMAARSEEEGGTEKLVAASEQLLAAKSRGPLILATMQQSLFWLEGADTAVAGKIADSLESAYQDHADEKLKAGAAKFAAASRKRLGLLGQTLVVEGKRADGEPFDWASYAGKVVLLDFWATWCGPCLEEIPNIRKNYEEFHEKGFEVVGINLDDEQEVLARFLTRQPLPWPTVSNGEGKDVGFKSRLAVQCGVEAIPFVLLIGRDGKVDSLHVRGPRLEKRLNELFASADPAAEKPATPEKPEAAETPEKAATLEKRLERPAVTPPGDDVPVNSLRNKGIKRTSFDEPAEDEPTPAKDDAPAARNAEDTADGTCGADEPAAPPTAEVKAEEAEVNPYSAKPNLSNEALVDYLFRMQDKPKSIRNRSGFTEAQIEACDRLMKQQPTESQTVIAIETKGNTLQRWAGFGGPEADKQLRAFTLEYRNDSRPRVTRLIDVLAREIKTADAMQTPLDGVPKMLDELKEYYSAEKLDNRHLRMASNTIALINRLEDDAAREKYYQEFGGLFAKSRDRELARYGKKLAAKGPSESEFVGQALELTGTTTEGTPFDIQSLRGKVVVVDFWATWCGPCRKELPHVQEAYAKYHEQGFEIVGVSLDADTDALKAFLEENPLPWQTLSGEGNQATAEKYGVRGIPTLMLLDKTGKITAVVHSIGQLQEQIEKLLKS